MVARHSGGRDTRRDTRIPPAPAATLDHHLHPGSLPSARFVKRAGTAETAPPLAQEVQLPCRLHTTQGTVGGVSTAFAQPVLWAHGDDGSTLSLIVGEDEWRETPRRPERVRVEVTKPGLLNYGREEKGSL